MAQFRITDSVTGKTVTVSGDGAPTDQEAAQIFQDAGLHDAPAPAQAGPAFDTAAQPSAAPGPPSFLDRLRANPVIGAPLQTLLRGGQGIEQLLTHAAASGADLGGYAPNPVGDRLRSVASMVDEAIAGQNQGYQESKGRVTAASTNPRVSEAATNTGEIMGNMLNPAGLVGNLIKVSPGLLNATLRGAASGAGFGASQPVENPGNFWPQKAGQVATGAGVGAATGAAAEALNGNTAPEPPSTKDLKTAASEAYKTAEDQGVVIRQDSFQNAVADIKATAQKAGIDEGLHPKAMAVLARFDKDAAQGPVTLEKAETLRRVASGALDSQAPSERRIAHIIVDRLDDYIGALKPADVASGVSGDPALISAFNLPTGDAAAATDALAQARDLYARSAKSAAVDRMVEKAKNAVGANYTAAGMDTALRQQFRALANNPRAFGRFSQAEQAAILQVVRGGPVQNTLRLIGKLSPNSTFPIASELAVAGTGHGDVAAGMALGGAVAKHIAAKMGSASVSALSDLIRRGGNASTLPRPAPNFPVGSPATALMVQSLLKPRAQ
jgi:hypothetical protein